MSKLIHKDNILRDKKLVSQTLGCRIFEPSECCFCQEVDTFVETLSKKEHDPNKHD